MKIYKNHNLYWNLDSFLEKYFKEGAAERRDVKKACEKYPALMELAELCHCVANFMPCPQGFNSAKGLLQDVRDYFPLMIDEIQRCIDEKCDMLYDGGKYRVDQETIKAWHAFFLENRQRYCLDMYYNVEKKYIKGIPLFTGQSLKTPTPITDEQVKECLENTISNIKKRAARIMERRQAGGVGDK